MAILSISASCTTNVSLSEDNKIFDGTDTLTDGDYYLVDGVDTRIDLDISVPLAILSISASCTTNVSLSEDNKIFDGTDTLTDGDYYLVDGVDTRIDLDISVPLAFSCVAQTSTDEVTPSILTSVSSSCVAQTSTDEVTPSILTSVSSNCSPVVSTNLVVTGITTKLSTSVVSSSVVSIVLLQVKRDLTFSGVNASVSSTCDIHIADYLVANCTQRTDATNIVLPTVINISSNCSVSLASSLPEVSTVELLGLSALSGTLSSTSEPQILVVRNLISSCVLGSETSVLSIGPLVLISGLCSIYTGVPSLNYLYDGVESLTDGTETLVDGPIVDSRISLGILDRLSGFSATTVSTPEVILGNTALVNISCSTIVHSSTIGLAIGGDLQELDVICSVEITTPTILSDIYTTLGASTHSTTTVPNPVLSIEGQISGLCVCSTSTLGVVLDATISVAASCTLQTETDELYLGVISSIEVACSISSQTSSLEVTKSNLISVSCEIVVETSSVSTSLTDGLLAICEYSTSTPNAAIYCANNLNVVSYIYTQSREPGLNISGKVELGGFCSSTVSTSFLDIHIIRDLEFSVNCDVVSKSLHSSLSISTDVFASCETYSLSYTCDILTTTNLYGSFSLGTSTTSISTEILTLVHASCQTSTDVSYPENTVLRLFSASCDVAVDIDVWYLLVQGSLVYMHAESTTDVMTSSPLYATVPFPDVEECLVYIYQNELTIDNRSIELSMVDVSSELSFKQYGY